MISKLLVATSRIMSGTGTMSSTKYSRPKEGDIIEVKDSYGGDWRKAEVLSALSIQFTYRDLEGKQVQYMFYLDSNWKPWTPPPEAA